MAVTTTKSSIATAIWIALGSSTGAFCFAAVLIAMVILALIPIYVPDHSQLGFGEEYRVHAMMLKSLYGKPPASATGNPYLFSNSTMADNTDLSTLCANTLRDRGQQNVAGCVVENLKAWGQQDNSSSSGRRRRAPDVFGLYTVGGARIFYSTACASHSDRGKYVANNPRSRCASQRLQACNTLFNYYNQARLTNWSRPSPSMAYSIVDTYFTNYIVVPVYQVFGVSRDEASSVVGQLSNSGPPGNTINQINLGCQYNRTLSQAEIANIIAAQANEVTTQPSSTQPNG